MSYVVALCRRFEGPLNRRHDVNLMTAFIFTVAMTNHALKFWTSAHLFHTKKKKKSLEKTHSLRRLGLPCQGQRRRSAPNSINTLSA